MNSAKIQSGIWKDSAGSFFSAGHTERCKAPEAEGYGSAEKYMIPHADDCQGHHHEDTAQAHGLSKAVFPAAVNSPGQNSLGKKGAQESQATDS